MSAPDETVVGSDVFVEAGRCVVIVYVSTRDAARDADLRATYGEMVERGEDLRIVYVGRSGAA